MFYRKFKLTAKAVLEKFGKDNVSKDTIVKFQKTPFDDIEIVHVVRPRSVFDPNKLIILFLKFEIGKLNISSSSL